MEFYDILRNFAVDLEIKGRKIPKGCYKNVKNLNSFEKGLIF